MRVKMAMISTAVAIANESTGATNHTARTILSRNALNSPDSWAAIFAVGVANDSVNFVASITYDSTGNVLTSDGATAGSDAAIDTRLSAIWDAYAGKP